MNEQECRVQMANLRFMAQFSRGLKEILTTVFIEAGQLERLPAHRILFKEGEPGDDSGCILLRGDVEIKKPDEPGFVCPAPELLGEMKQFNPKAKRTATVETATDAVLLQFNWANFRTVLGRYVSEADMKTVQSGLETYAWEHFTQ